MGNSNWSDSAALGTVEADQWRSVGYYEDHEVLAHRITGEQCEQYYFTRRAHQRHQDIMQEYAFRSRQEGNIVKVLYARRVTSLALCSENDQYQVWTERVPWRLHDLKDIPLQECLFLVVEAIYGFVLLRQHGKQFVVDSGCIGITPRGRVRVWTNKYFATDDQPAYRSQQTNSSNQQEIVQGLFSTVREHTVNRQYPELLEAKIAEAVSFQSALNVVYDFCKEAGVRLPSCMRTHQPKTHIRMPGSPNRNCKTEIKAMDATVASLQTNSAAVNSRERSAEREDVYNRCSPASKNGMPRMFTTTRGERSVSRDSAIGRAQHSQPPNDVNGGLSMHQSKAILFKQQKRKQRDQQALSKAKEVVLLRRSSPKSILMSDFERDRSPTARSNSKSNRTPAPSTPAFLADGAVQKPQREKTSPKKQPSSERGDKPQERSNHLLSQQTYQIVPKEQYLRQSREQSRSNKTPSKVTFTFFNSRQLKVQDQANTDIQETNSVLIEAKEPTKELTERTTTPRASEDLVKTSLMLQSRGRASPQDPEKENSPGKSRERPKKVTSPVEALTSLSHIQSPAVLSTSRSSILPVPSEPPTLPITFEYCSLYSRTVNSFIYHNEYPQPSRKFDRNPNHCSAYEAGDEPASRREEADQAADRPTDDPVKPRFLRLQVHADKMCNSLTKESFLSQKTSRQSTIELVAKLFPGLPTLQSQVACSLSESSISQNLDSLNERHKQGIIYESRQA